MAATVLEVFHLATDSGGYDQDGKPFEKHTYKVRWSSPDHYPLDSIGKNANGVYVPYWGKQLKTRFYPCSNSDRLPEDRRETELDRSNGYL